MRILIVEDYEPLRLALSKALRESGHTVDGATDGPSGCQQGLSNRYDVIILDLMLPGMDGLDVLRRLRGADVASHVLVLTARDEVKDRVEGLDAGADDYLAKPFSMEEVQARVRALVRRHYSVKDPILSIASVEIDTVARQVKVAGVEVALTAREYALLEYLAHRVGQVVSREEIWKHFYEGRSSASSNVIDVYVSYLRAKLEGPGRPKILHTRRGQGYVLGEQS
ncbi:MAG: two-component system copper resistance phosphate regulon response regulator CusR [Planctomycetota bacterium]|jgi:two-component system copper resistance phosphate regulon response regulator CusR